MEFHLCQTSIESPGCFQKLAIVGGSEDIIPEERMCVPYPNSETRILTARLQLPAGVRCNRCTLRWTYRTAYPGWGCMVNQGQNHPGQDTVQKWFSNPEVSKSEKWGKPIQFILPHRTLAYTFGKTLSSMKKYHV